ncbi:hypothetical protein DBV15_07054 [Temnothorax longispinosus]|uniref:Uncharacterized protein n=1 Tax=Temnothorax longispinosus TaxID=300112 RepID=A0A4V3SAC3_9HYME|nr:hypothetical protein DBV15_07054 [Temnothorax longispinosus]
MIIVTTRSAIVRVAILFFSRRIKKNERQNEYESLERANESATDSSQVSSPDKQTRFLILKTEERLRTTDGSNDTRFATTILKTRYHLSHSDGSDSKIRMTNCLTLLFDKHHSSIYALWKNQERYIYRQKYSSHVFDDLSETTGERLAIIQLAASLQNERSTVEGFIQIKRHEIHHDALESRFRRSLTEENPRPGAGDTESEEAAPNKLGRFASRILRSASTSGEF